MCQHSTQGTASALPCSTDNLFRVLSVHFDNLTYELLDKLVMTYDDVDACLCVQPHNTYVLTYFLLINVLLFNMAYYLSVVVAYFY